MLVVGSQRVVAMNNPKANTHTDGVSKHQPLLTDVGVS